MINTYVCFFTYLVRVLIACKEKMQTLNQEVGWMYRKNREKYRLKLAKYITSRNNKQRILFHLAILATILKFLVGPLTNVWGWIVASSSFLYAL